MYGGWATGVQPGQHSKQNVGVPCAPPPHLVQFGTSHNGMGWQLLVGGGSPVAVAEAVAVAVVVAPAPPAQAGQSTCSQSSASPTSQCASESWGVRDLRARCLCASERVCQCVPV